MVELIDLYSHTGKAPLMVSSNPVGSHIKTAAGLGVVLGAIEVHHALASGDIPMLKPMLMALQ